MKTARLLNAVAVLALAGTDARAADIYLCAGKTAMTMPGDVQVPMWGFAQQAAAEQLIPGCGAQAQVPGPLLRLSPTDDTLTIHLYNDALPEAVSVVIPGQDSRFAGAFTEAQGRRVRSLDKETAPGTMETYVWTGLAPGTYVYHSGSHPQVQVQMGLYGGMTKDAAPGQAYAGVPYDTEVTLLFSEIDPALHQAVASGSYGSASYSSTTNYRPGYFLVNGAPFVDPPAAFLTAGAAGGRTLIRFLNMGLKTHVPTLQGADMSIVAEDGNPYPYPKIQYSVMLAATKTKDAIFSPPANGVYPLSDRIVTNAGSSPGGMFRFLEVDSPGPPQTVGARFRMDRDRGPLNVAAPGILGNDTALNGDVLNAVRLGRIGSAWPCKATTPLAIRPHPDTSDWMAIAITRTTPLPVIGVISDFGLEGMVAAASVAVARSSRNGLAVSDGDGAFAHTQNDKLGATSNEAAISVMLPAEVPLQQGREQ